MQRAAEVQEVVEKLSGDIPGSRAYTAKYQTGLKQVAEKLTDAEKEELFELAKQWTEESPPEQLQQK